MTRSYKASTTICLTELTLWHFELLKLPQAYVAIHTNTCLDSLCLYQIPNAQCMQMWMIIIHMWAFSQDLHPLPKEYQNELTFLLQSMLQPNPVRRPTLEKVLQQLKAIAPSSRHPRLSGLSNELEEVCEFTSTYVTKWMIRNFVNTKSSLVCI